MHPATRILVGQIIRLLKGIVSALEQWLRLMDAEGDQRTTR